jgi:hypothetical protein
VEEVRRPWSGSACSALSLSLTSCLVRPVTLRRVRFPSGPKPSETAPTYRPDRFEMPLIWWSGTGSNCRPSAFQVNRAKRYADQQKRTSLTSETALGGRCEV